MIEQLNELRRAFILHGTGYIYHDTAKTLIDYASRHRQLVTSGDEAAIMVIELAIQNFVSNNPAAFAGCQAIFNRDTGSGTVRIKFPDGSQVVPEIQVDA